MLEIASLVLLFSQVIIWSYFARRSYLLREKIRKHRHIDPTKAGTLSVLLSYFEDSANEGYYIFLINVGISLVMFFLSLYLILRG